MPEIRRLPHLNVLCHAGSHCIATTVGQLSYGRTSPIECTCWLAVRLAAPACRSYPIDASGDSLGLRTQRSRLRSRFWAARPATPACVSVSLGTMIHPIGIGTWSSSLWSVERIRVCSFSSLALFGRACPSAFWSRRGLFLWSPLLFVSVLFTAKKRPTTYYLLPATYGLCCTTCYLRHASHTQ